jgi:hypothetical protein
MMRLSRVAIILACIISLHIGSALGQKASAVSLCLLQKNPETFFHSTVEVDAVIFVGMESGQLLDGKCSFRFAFWDDHQAFGDRFHVDHDVLWDRMMSLEPIS